MVILHFLDLRKNKLQESAQEPNCTIGCFFIVKHFCNLQIKIKIHYII